MAHMDSWQQNASSSQASIWVTDDTDSERLLYRSTVPVMLVFCAIAFFTNLSILIAVHWVRRNLSPTLCFSVSLAVADAYASLVLGVGLLINSLLPFGYDVHLGTMCTTLVLEGFRLAGLIISVLHLLLLAVNHYLGIIRPLHYASTMTRRNALLSIALMWILPLIFIFVYLGSVSGQGFQSDGCEDLTFLLMKQFRGMIASLFFAPLLLMLVMYVHMFMVVYQHNRALQNYQGTSNHFRHNVKAAITTLVIIGTYTVGWMPAICFYVVVCFDCVVKLEQWLQDSERDIFFITMTNNTLMILKYVVNPIIYATRMKDIHLAFRRMLASCWPRYCSVAGARDDSITSSSYFRSRNDTMQTTIRLQSVYGGRGRSSASGSSPILVYQKCQQGGGTSVASCRNGIIKPGHHRPNGRHNSAH